jgi:hypothetical protein
VDPRSEETKPRRTRRSSNHVPYPACCCSRAGCMLSRLVTFFDRGEFVQVTVPTSAEVAELEIRIEDSVSRCNICDLLLQRPGFRFFFLLTC